MTFKGLEWLIFFLDMYLNDLFNDSFLKYPNWSSARYLIWMLLDNNFSGFGFIES